MVKWTRIEESVTEVDGSARLLDLLQIMRGFPPLQIFLLGLAFGMLAVPLYQLTGQTQSMPGNATEAEAAPAGGSSQPDKVEALIRLRYAHQPKSVSLKQGDRELLKDADLAASPLEISTDLMISKDGNELTLQATWPEGTPDTALTLEIEPDGLEVRKETLWSADAALDEILTLTW